MTEIATFGAGCFWGVEHTFRELDGVTDTAVGYLGGTLVNPTYHDVCTGRTGHAEVVQITFDPAKISFERLCDIFFHSPEQEAVAQKAKQKWDNSGKYRRPIVTEITAASPFYKGEDYHQQYFAKRGMASCHTAAFV